MAFAPCLSSTPKFVPVMNQPSHFILSAPILQKIEKQRQLTKPTLRSYCRPLKKCSRYHSQQSNASTAINRQQQFDNDITIHNNQQHIFFCLPFNFFHISKRRRHGPCHV
ncbi:unnamed protein product [Rotaria magnacalcarata]|uniref:Uncharacterized protein n=1 Tax=Rotaria magnacalcarata TaxID=392030 RepID=A0A819R6Z9_9BILA|nr:unnamed protein product [Rotaria magnacalcarata]CAF1683633.1 unnamed protein product [Rotaria magnacalcarata]CAF2118133.1 unnamed protein product [Rotaria magnacalcarata]CAF2244434.1 unnamed protein product [Rotaria magnacalcarata]CAF2267679.1 unnamed protein product [Rotaria magnacalcarata]